NVELSDHFRWIVQLLRIFVLSQMLVPESSPKVSDVPDTIPILRNLHIFTVGENLLVKRVSDDLACGVARFPAFKNLLDIQIESAFGGTCHVAPSSRTVPS